MGAEYLEDLDQWECSTLAQDAYYDAQDAYHDAQDEDKWGLSL